MNEAMDIVVVDDDPADLELMSRISNDAAGASVIHCVQDVAGLEDALQRFAPKVVLVDHYLGHSTGTELIEKYHRTYPRTAFVLLTARGDEKVASEALRAGATDYLRKDELTAESLSALLARVWRKMEEKEHVQAALAVLSDGIATLDEHRCILHCNLAMESLLGESESELIGKPLEAFLSPEDSEKLATLFALAGGEFDEPLEVTVRATDGTKYSVELTVSSFEVGTLENYVVVLRDVDYKKRILQDVDKQAALITATSDYIGYSDAKGRIQYLNPAAKNLLGMEDTGDFLDRLTIYDLFPASMQSKLTTKVVPLVMSGNRWSGDGLMRGRNDQMVPVSIVMSGVANDEGKVETITFIMRDVSTEKARQQRLYRAANYDPLTGLANRTMIRKQISHILTLAERRSRRFAVLYLDIDHFKQINDSFGHESGDKLLKVVAERLLTTVRGTDLVARLGGDEFVIVMEEINDDTEMSQLADRVLTLLRHPISIADQDLHLSASIGIADYPACGRQVSELLHKADTAMYQAKLAGRNRMHFYSSALTGLMNERHSMASSIRTGVERKEFSLDLTTLVDGQQHTIGMRADFAWHKPDGNVVPSSVYLNTAAQIGLHTELQQMFIDSLAHRLAQLKTSFASNGRVPKVLISMVPSQLSDSTLMDRLVSQLADAGLKGYSISIEFPEAALQENAPGLIESLGRVSEAGMSLTMRDFKLKHSSIDRLKSLPIDSVLLCPSLTEKLDSDDKQRQIVSGLITITRALGIELIADKISSEDQFEFLQEQGVAVFAGSLFRERIPSAQPSLA